MTAAVAVDGLVLRTLAHIGRIAIFFAEMVVQCGRVLARPNLVIYQIYNAGGRSLVIIMLSGLFTGMVLALLGFNLLQRFGSEDALGFAAALALLKELGPVLTALLFAGRAGTALTSEIGLMRATDQLTAMQMMAVDPLRYVVAPRFLGGLISMPLLTAVYDVVGLFGAHLVGVQMLRRRQRFVLVADAKCREPARCQGRHRQERGVWFHLQPDCRLRGLSR